MSEVLNFDEEYARQAARRAQLRARRNGDLVLMVLAMAALAVLGLAVVFLLAVTTASAATITINPGQTIQSGISAASAGDTVVVNAGTYTGGIVLNKSVTVQGNGSVTVQPATVGSGQAFNIDCSDCGIIGLYFLNFNSIDWVYGENRQRVTLKNNKFLFSGSLGIDGVNWVVEGNDFGRPIRGSDNTMTMFGVGHMVRNNIFRPWKLPEDVAQGQHFDHIQSWNNNGETIRDWTLERNLFMGYVQGVLIQNNNRDTALATRPQNITVQDNIFAGDPLPTSPVSLDRPSHGLFLGVGPIPGCVVRNNIFDYEANHISLYGMPTTTIVQGNIISNGGATYTLVEGTTNIDRGALGNVQWNFSWERLPKGPDKYLDPQYTNMDNPLGADGVLWTADDGWRPTNAAVASYGPRGATTPVPANRAPAAVNDAATAAYNSPGVIVMVLANDSDPDGDVLTVASIGAPSAGGTTAITADAKTVSYTPKANNAAALVESFTYSVSDGKGGTGVGNVSVSVAGPPAAPPATVWEFFRVRDVNNLRIWVKGSRQTAKPTEVP